ncbi:MAG: aa3-type cytochrome c oxidase subunit IV [Pseudomonadota bacterium]
MAKYKPGEMDVSEQEKTFDGFIKAGVWLSVITIVILVFLAIVGI